jgi:hypothetical protein
LLDSSCTPAVTEIHRAAQGRAGYIAGMTTTDEVLAPLGRLAARLAGWESRPQQMAMASLVAAAIRDRHHAIVEAGTGTGKSLAYLVPAVLAATADQEAPVARPPLQRAQFHSLGSSLLIAATRSQDRRSRPAATPRAPSLVYSRRAKSPPAHAPPPS